MVDGTGCFHYSEQCLLGINAKSKPRMVVMPFSCLEIACNEIEASDQHIFSIWYVHLWYSAASHCGIVLGALLGTQNGQEVEIVNTFELAMEDDGETVDHAFLVSRRDQCTLSFPMDPISQQIRI